MLLLLLLLVFDTLFVTMSEEAFTLPFSKFVCLFVVCLFVGLFLVCLLVRLFVVYLFACYVCIFQVLGIFPPNLLRRMAQPKAHDAQAH